MDGRVAAPTSASGNATLTSKNACEDSGRGIELLVEHATELARGHWLVRDTQVVPAGRAQELQVRLAGQDDARDGLVEQGPDGKNGFGAGPAPVQPVVRNHDVWWAAPFPDPGHSLVRVGGGDHLIA